MKLPDHTGMQSYKKKDPKCKSSCELVAFCKDVGNKERHDFAMLILKVSLISKS